MIISHHRNLDGNTALHQAVMRRHVAIVDELLHAGCDPGRVNEVRRCVCVCVCVCVSKKEEVVR